MKKKVLIMLFGIFFIFITLFSLLIISGQDSESSDEWWMFHKYLNHTSWDGIDFPVIPGLNSLIYETQGGIYSSPAVANGYVYIGSYDGIIYQLNASNISQLVHSYTTGGAVYSSPAVANGYVYVGSQDTKVYQLNASNVSQLISFYTTNHVVNPSPAVANGYVYIASLDKNVYQLNASNVSQLISDYTTGDGIQSSPAVANGYVYIGSYDDKIYQLNASNISQFISSYTTGDGIQSGPTVSNGYVYVGSQDHKIYQLNSSNVSQLISFYTTGHVVEGSPAVANGYVYIGSYDGIIYQLNASNLFIGNNILYITINSPANISYAFPTIVFNITARYNMGIDTCWFTLDSGVTNTTLNQEGSSDYYSYTNSSMNNGVYTAEFYCNDSWNQLNTTENISFVVDTTVPPLLSITSPLSTHYTTSQIVFNITSIDYPGVDACWFTLNSGVANITLEQDGSTDYYNFTNSSIPDGTYTAQFYCNSTSGNLNNTESVSFIIDTMAPLISYTGVTEDDAAISTNNYITVAVSLIESYLSSITYYLYNESAGSIDSTGLLGYWNFDEENDPIITDSSDNENHGENEGSTFNSSGAVNAARTFDETDDYINITTDSLISDTGSSSVGSFSAWINFGTVASYDAILSFTGPDTDFCIVTPHLNLLIRNEIGNNKIIYVQQGYCSTNFVLKIDDALSMNTWYHVAVVQNGTEPVIYVNGTKVAQTFVDSTDKTTWWSDLKYYDTILIGAQSSDFLGRYMEYHFDGSIDEVKIWSRVLSEAEIQKVYNEGLVSRILIDNTTYVSSTTEHTWSSLENANYSYDVEVIDLGGLSNSTGRRTITLDYTETSDDSEDSSTPGSGSVTYYPSNEDLEQGYERRFYENWKVNFKVNEEEKTVVVEDISEDEVIFSVDDVDYSVKINDTTKIDFDNDGYYDLQVSALNSNGHWANLEFKEIHEEVPAEEQESVEEVKKWFGENKVYVLIVLGFVLLFVLKHLFGRKN